MKKVTQQKQQQMVKKSSSVSKTSPHLYQPPQQMSSQFIKPSQTTKTPPHTINSQLKFISPPPTPSQMIKPKSQLDRIQIHELDSLIKSPVGETPQKLAKIQQESRKKQKVFAQNTTSKIQQQQPNPNKKTPKTKPKKESVKLATNDHMISNYDLNMVFNSIYQSTLLNRSTANNDNLHLTYQMPFIHNFNKDNSNCDSAFNQLNYLLYPNNPIHASQASSIKSTPMHRSPSSVSTSSSATNVAKIPVTSPIATIDLTKKMTKPTVATTKWQSHSTQLKTNKSSTSSSVRVLSLPKKPITTSSTTLKSNYIVTTTSKPKPSNYILPKSSPHLQLLSNQTISLLPPQNQNLQIIFSLNHPNQALLRLKLQIKSKSKNLQLYLHHPHLLPPPGTAIYIKTSIIFLTPSQLQIILINIERGKLRPLSHHTYCII